MALWAFERGPVSTEPLSSCFATYTECSFSYTECLIFANAKAMVVVVEAAFKSTSEHLGSINRKINLSNSRRGRRRASGRFRRNLIAFPDIWRVSPLMTNHLTICRLCPLQNASHLTASPIHSTIHLVKKLFRISFHDWAKSRLLPVCWRRSLYLHWMTSTNSHTECLRHFPWSTFRLNT